ncbi:hypothetical protein Moror_6710 [Moniliophthora roreri MCA 2997]|uniref:Uncharacterized protein n=2 Tax=Moniliophthora roreri TaxID=221103 RepID=V2XW30_MONRO|nr:hypothetical protein Moror_6710 [Moniliophthora roreri MCA 2997]
METPGSQDIPDVAPYYGPIYIADLITFGMWSIVCLQTFRYFTKYPKDRVVFKIMVIVQVALLNVELGFIIARGYGDLVSNFGNPESAFRAVPEYAYNLLFSTVIATLVQSFLAYRVWIFVGRKYIVPIIFIPMAIFELLAVSIYVARVLTLQAQAHHKLPLSAVYDIREQKLMLAYYSVSPVVDMAIAGFMFYYLSKKSNETPFTGCVCFP